jgi:hypothetical protein
LPDRFVTEKALEVDLAVGTVPAAVVAAGARSHLELVAGEPEADGDDGPTATGATVTTKHEVGIGVLPVKP